MFGRHEDADVPALGFKVPTNAMKKQQPEAVDRCETGSGKSHKQGREEENTTGADPVGCQAREKRKDCGADKHPCDDRSNLKGGESEQLQIRGQIDADESIAEAAQRASENQTFGVRGSTCRKDHSGKKDTLRTGLKLGDRLPTEALEAETSSLGVE